jgi:hypothetical protein
LEKGETEWTLNVRGIEFRWKAISKMLKNPKGIMWETTSGLKNKGQVECIKVSEKYCLMRVKMALTALVIFKNTGEFVKDFMESINCSNGVWELGDALFGAFKGRYNAIEATLSYPRGLTNRANSLCYSTISIALRHMDV